MPASEARTRLPTRKLLSDLVIDFENGAKTNPEPKLHSEENGPFPAVLLVHGSGLPDMDETLVDNVKVSRQIFLVW